MGEKDKKTVVVRALGHDEAQQEIEAEMERVRNADDAEEGIAISGKMTPEGPVGEVVLSKRLRDDVTAKLPPVPPMGELEEIKQLPALALVCLVDAMKKVAMLYAERHQPAEALEAIRQMRLLMEIASEKMRQERAQAGQDENSEVCDCPNCTANRVTAMAQAQLSSPVPADAVGAKQVRDRALEALESWTPNGMAS